VPEESEPPPIPESGPPEEFAALFAEIGTILWQIAWHTARRLDGEGCGNASTLVCDIYQEICLHLWGCLPQWRAEGKRTHWVAKVAKNKAIDIYRRLRREKRVVSLDDPDWEFLKNVYGRNAQVDTGLPGAVRECLETLPERQCEAFVMHHVDGLSYDDIANGLGCLVATIRVWVFRARQSLIKCLATKGIAGAHGGVR
jgi:RNA polymerase sigma-70 factor (ECF subfamily)